MTTLSDMAKDQGLRAAGVNTVPVRFRDNLGRIVEVRNIGNGFFFPCRQLNGEWVRVPTGGNCHNCLTSEASEKELIKHAGFMGWERVTE